MQFKIVTFINKWKCYVDHPSRSTKVDQVRNRSVALCCVFDLKFNGIHLTQVVIKFWFFLSYFQISLMYLMTGFVQTSSDETRLWSLSTLILVASIYTLSLCRGHSWRVRLAKQETLTPPGHLVSPLVCKGPPWYSIVFATVTVHQFFCILHFCPDSISPCIWARVQTALAKHTLANFTLYFGYNVFITKDIYLLPCMIYPLGSAVGPWSLQWGLFTNFEICVL